jgi:uncharacterized protein YbjT (DUF2867 family)
MKVLVFGATGKTGALVVESALGKGHEVTVMVRDAGKYKTTGASVLAGDATKPEDVFKAMQGQEGVIDTIGGTTPFKKTHLESASAHNIVQAMRKEGARRLVVVSMMGIGESRAQAPFWYKYLLMPTFLRGSTPDKIAMEQEVSASGLDYVIARPPILKDAPPTGKVVVLGLDQTGHAITRADLANFLVEQLETDAQLRRAVTVVNS